MLSAPVVPMLFNRRIDSKETALQPFFVSGTAIDALEVLPLASPERMDAIRGAGFGYAAGNLDLAQTFRSIRIESG